MDISTIEKVKKSFMVGDIFDRILVNSIKISRNDDKIGKKIKKENELLTDLIDEIWDKKIDDKLLNQYRESLHGVLQQQWDLLDIVFDLNESELRRGKCAILAQELNIKRVHWKNEINILFGSVVENKFYGKT